MEVKKMVKITRSVAEKRLAEVEQEKQFWCHDGQHLKNLQELQAALEEMKEETFHVHVNETKNDFSTWVNDVIGDDKLARDLRKSVTPAQAARAVASRIAFLKK
jgi:hypothetical protein